MRSRASGWPQVPGSSRCWASSMDARTKKFRKGNATPLHEHHYETAFACARERSTIEHMQVMVVICPESPLWNPEATRFRSSIPMRGTTDLATATFTSHEWCCVLRK